MRNLPLLFCGIFFALAFSYVGLIVSGNSQLGDLQRTTETLVPSDDDPDVLVNSPGDPLYPRKLSGLAEQGKQVYIEMGCVYCHSQQSRRQEFGADVDRGWARRPTVPRDYILQERVLVGTMRTGPDLVHLGRSLCGRRRA